MEVLTSSLLAQIKEGRNEGFEQQDLIMIVFQAMQIAETYKNLSAVEKNALVVSALRKLIDEVITDETIQPILKLMLPQLVKSTAAAARHGSGINDRSMFSCCGF
jgi:hypothetical protein